MTTFELKANLASSVSESITFPSMIAFSALSIRSCNSFIVYAFCKQQWGIEIAHRLIETYQRNKKRLSSNPYMAPIEPLLANREYVYRLYFHSVRMKSANLASSVSESITFPSMIAFSALSGIPIQKGGCMTTFELKRSILQDINALMDDEAAMLYKVLPKGDELHS